MSVPVRKGPWLLLQPHRRRQQLRHPLPAPGRPGSRATGSAPTGSGPGPRRDPRGRADPAGREPCWPRATSTSPWAPSRSAPTTGGWPTRRTPPAASATRCSSPTWTTGEDVPRDPARHLLRGGVGQRQRHRLLHPGGRGHAPLPAVAPPGGHRPGRRHPGLRGERRPLLPRGRPHQGRRYVRHGPRLQGDHRGLGLAADDPRGGSGSSSPAATGSSTASTTTGPIPTAGRASRFLIVTNDGAEDFRLMEAADATPGPRPLDRGHRGPGRASGWTTWTPSPATWSSTSGRGARPRSGSSTSNTGASHAGRQPETPSTVWPWRQPRVRLVHLPLRVHLAGHPPFGLRRDLATGEPVLSKRQPVLGDFDPGRYRTERRWATADDGTGRPPLAGLPADDRADLPG